MAPPTSTQVSMRPSKEDLLQHWRNLKDGLIPEIEHIKKDFGKFWDLDDELDQLVESGKKTAEIFDFYLENKECLTGDQIRSILDFYEKYFVDKRTVDHQVQVESVDSLTESEDLHSDSVSSEKPEVVAAVTAGGSSESSGSHSLPSDYKGIISSRSGSGSNISSVVRSCSFISLTNVVSSIGQDEMEATCDCLYQQYFQDIETRDDDSEVGGAVAMEEIGGDIAMEEIDATAMEEIGGATAMEETEGAAAMEVGSAASTEKRDYFVFEDYTVYDNDVAMWLKEHANEITWEEVHEGPNLLSLMRRIKKRSPQYHLIKLSEKLIWKMKKKAYKREMNLRRKWLKDWNDVNDEQDKCQKEQKKLEQKEKKLLKEQKRREDRKLRKELEEEKKLQKRQKRKEKREREKRRLFVEKLPKNELNKTEVEDMLLRCGTATLNAQLDEIECLCQIIGEANADLFHTEEGMDREIDELQYADMQSKESMLLRKCMVIDPEILKRQKFIHTLIKSIDLCAFSDDADSSRMARELIDILKTPKKVPKFLDITQEPDGTTSVRQKRKVRHAVHRAVEATPSSDTLAGAEEILEEIQSPSTRSSSTQNKDCPDTLNLPVPVVQDSSGTSVLSPMEEYLDATGLKFMDDPSTCSMEEANSE